MLEANGWQIFFAVLMLAIAALLGKGAYNDGQVAAELSAVCSQLSSVLSRQERHSDRIAKTESAISKLSTIVSNQEKFMSAKAGELDRLTREHDRQMGSGQCGKQVEAGEAG